MLRAVGLKGELKVELFRPRRSPSLNGSLILSREDGASLERSVVRARFVDPLHAVVGIEGIADRTEAEAWQKAGVDVDLDRADSFALIDRADRMLHLLAFDDATGRTLGTISHIEDNGAQTVLAIAPFDGEGGEERLVPLVDAFVLGVERGEDGQLRVRIRTIPGLVDD